MFLAGGGLVDPLGDAVGLLSAGLALHGPPFQRGLGVAVGRRLGDRRVEPVFQRLAALLRVSESHDRQHQGQGEPGADVAGDLDHLGRPHGEPSQDDHAAQAGDRPQTGGIEQKGQEDRGHGQAPAMPVFMTVRPATLRAVSSCPRWPGPKPM